MRNRGFAKTVITRNKTEHEGSGTRPEFQDVATSSRLPLSMLAVSLALFAAFAWMLRDLALFAFKSNVYSHILIIPLISAYLILTSRRTWKFNAKPRSWPAAIFFLVGIVILAFYAMGVREGWSPSPADRLAVLVISMVLLLWGIACAYLPMAELRKAAFPLALLIFLAPFPTVVLNSIEAFLQHRSADVAHFLFSLAGTPLLRDDTVFQLPGITLNVAPECSGIRSTLALFITSLVGGYVILRSPWRRTALAAFVIPLALFRNGLRVFTIGELCVHISPDMVHSIIHRKGGPLFFALSLIPFVLVLLWLRRSERPARDKIRETKQSNS